MCASGGELILDLFLKCGIENIFCSPGTEWVPIWESLSKRRGHGREDLNYFDCRHEMLAVSMAMGFTEITGRSAAVLLHAGVGPLHAAMAIRTAYLAQVPMIICSGESFDHTGQVTRPPGGHWISFLSDLGGSSTLVKPYVKWSNTVRTEEDLVDSVYRGCIIAQTPPRGPVFLSISRELLLQPMAGTGIDGCQLSIGRPLKLNISEEDVEVAAGQLVKGEHPVILTEYSGRNPDNIERLTELAELLSAPVFESSFPFFCNIDKDHPLYMGSDSKEALQQADIVLVIGSAVPWYPPKNAPRNARTILLDEFPAHEKLPYWGYKFDTVLNADIGEGLKALVKSIRPKIKYQKRPGDNGLRYWRIKHNALMGQWRQEAEAGISAKPISSKWFFYRARQILPENTIILNESIVHSPFIERYLGRTGHYMRLGYGALGTGIGQAAGIKLASPDCPVVLFVGDGALNYNPVPAALGLSQQYGLPFLIIVLNNKGYMAMKKDHQQSYPEGWSVSRNDYLGVNIAPTPDYSGLAKIFGGRGQRLEHPGDIERVLKWGLRQLKNGKITLIDVLVDTP